MTRRRRWEVIGLVALALVTVILVVWSLPQTRNPIVPGTPAPVPVATLDETEPAETPSPSTTTSSTPKPSATPSPALTGLSGFATLLKRDEPVSVLVMGDGSGNETDEWVHLWAHDHLAADRQVRYHAWNADSSQWGKAATMGKGPKATVWNASKGSPDLAKEAKRLTAVWRAADVVILSYGHRGNPKTIASQLEDMRKAVAAKNKQAIVLVMIQNPDPVATQYTQADTTKAVKAWANMRDLDTVNIYDAFVSDPAPRYSLVEFDGSPTPLGSALWARTFAEAIAHAR